MPTPGFTGQVSPVRQQFCDSNGHPLAGGRVYHYLPDTTTPANTWADPDFTILNSNPVILDAAGRAAIYSDRTLRQILRDRNDVLIWDGETTTNLASNSAAPLTLDDIAALRANTLPYPLYYLQGYFDPVDGIDGFFRWDEGDTTSPDNGGSVIVDAGGRRYKRLDLEGPVDVRKFGAKGDGVANDTTAFTNAIAYSAATDKAILRSQGTYVTSTSPNDVSSYPLTKATIAALRANTVPYPIYYVQGYYAVGDGASGCFRWDQSDTSTADNGGTVIVDADGRRYKRDFSPGFVHVLWFGAKGDDVTDDSDAIQAAMDSLGIDGGMVIFDAKKYRVTKTLVIKTHCMTLKASAPGQNNNIGTTITGLGTHDILTNLPDVSSFITLDTISLENPTTGLSSSHHVNFQRAGYVTIRSCLFRNIWNGIRFEGISQGTIEDVEVRNALATSGTSYGIALVSGTYDTLGIRLNNLRMFGINDTPGSIAILNQGSGTTYVSQVAITKWENGIKLEADSTGVTPFFTHLHQVETESCGVGYWIDQASRFTAVDCQAALSAEEGWKFGPTGPGEILMSACKAINNGYHGYKVDGGGTNCSFVFDGCTSFGNSQASVGSYDGLHVNQTANVRVVGGQYGGGGINAPVTTTTHRNALRFVGSPSAECMVGLVDVRGTVSDSIAASGTILPVIIACPGYPDAFVQARSIASVNFLQLIAAVSGLGVALRAFGADPNINLLLQSKGSGYIAVDSPLVLPAFTVAQLLDGVTLPPASYPGGLVRCTNGSSNRELAISDGAAWRFPDGNIVS